MAWTTRSPREWQPGELVTAAEWNDSIRVNDEAIMKAPESAPPAGVATVVAAAAVMAGSEVKVSRRGLLGFGWLRSRG